MTEKEIVLETIRALPDDCLPDTVAGWHSQVLAHSRSLARAIHLIELAAADPPLRAAIDAAVKQAQTSFGPTDGTRARRPTCFSGRQRTDRSVTVARR